MDEANNTATVGKPTNSHSSPRDSLSVTTEQPRTFRRRWRQPLLITIAMVGAIAAFGWWLAVVRKAASDPEGALFVEADSLDFGEVYAQREFRWELAVQNRSKWKLVVDGFQSDCSCVSVKPASMEIDPQSSATIILTLDLRGRRTAEERDVWEHSVTIRPQIRGSLFAAGDWMLRGRVRRHPVIPIPASVELRYVRGLSQNAATQFRLKAVEPLSGLAIDATPSSPVELKTRKDSRGHFAVEARLSQPNKLPIGMFTTFAIVRSRDAHNTPLPELRVPIHVSVADDVQFVPPMVRFGAIEVGKSVTGFVALRSQSTSRFQIVRIRRDADDVQFHERRQRRRDKTEYEFDVHFQRIEAGFHRRVVHFVIRSSPDGPEREIPLEVSYHGI